MRVFSSLITAAIFLTGCAPQAAAPPAKPAPPPLMQIAVPPTPPPAAPAAPPPNEIVKAEVGVGKQGRSLDQHEGLIVTPVKGLFAAKEMIAFDVMVPQLLGLFAATEGRYPKSHEEFWEKVIVANHFEPQANKNAPQLPELPAGHRYLYDVEKHELMVERPAK